MRKRLWFVLLSAFCAPVLDAAPSAAVVERMGNVQALFCEHPGSSETVFAPTFLDAIPPEKIASLFTETFARSGKCVSFKEQGPSVQFPQSGENGALYQLNFEHGPSLPCDLAVEPKPPHRIAGLLIGAPPPTPTPVAAQPSEGNKQDSAAAADALLGKLYPPDAPGAVVLIARDGAPILRKAYGVADLELPTPMTPAMRLRIGSVTKQFTAIAVLLLAHDGKLSLDDPLTKHIPGYPVQGQKITLRQLLNHTAGLNDFTNSPDFSPRDREDLTPSDLVTFAASKPLDFMPPGSRFHYTNSGYLLLGAIIEKISGHSYGDFLRERIFEPLGMKDTMVDREGRVLHDRASGYTRAGADYVNAPFISMSVPYAAGDLISTVDDLLTWDNALNSEKLLPAEWLAKAWTSATLPDGRDTHYGFGWIVSRYKNHSVILHNGEINGFRSCALRLPEQHLFVALLQNSNGAGAPDPMETSLQLASAVLGETDQPLKPVDVPPEKLKPLTGSYQGENDQRVISLDGKQLFSQRTGGPKLPLHPLSDSEFFFDDSSVRLTFKRGDKGKVLGVEAANDLGIGVWYAR